MNFFLLFKIYKSTNTNLVQERKFIDRDIPNEKNNIVDEIVFEMFFMSNIEYYIQNLENRQKEQYNTLYNNYNIIVELKNIIEESKHYNPEDRFTWIINEIKNKKVIFFETIKNKLNLYRQFDSNLKIYGICQDFFNVEKQIESIDYHNRFLFTNKQNKLINTDDYFIGFWIHPQFKNFDLFLLISNFLEFFKEHIKESNSLKNLIPFVYGKNFFQKYFFYKYQRSSTSLSSQKLELYFKIMNIKIYNACKLFNNTDDPMHQSSKSFIYFKIDRNFNYNNKQENKLFNHIENLKNKRTNNSIKNGLKIYFSIELCFKETMFDETFTSIDLVDDFIDEIYEQKKTLCFYLVTNTIEKDWQNYSSTTLIMKFYNLLYISIVKNYSYMTQEDIFDDVLCDELGFYFGQMVKILLSYDKLVFEQLINKFKNSYEFAMTVDFKKGFLLELKNILLLDEFNNFKFDNLGKVKIFFASERSNFKLSKNEKEVLNVLTFFVYKNLIFESVFNICENYCFEKSLKNFIKTDFLLNLDIKAKTISLLTNSNQNTSKNIFIENLIDILKLEESNYMPVVYYFFLSISDIAKNDEFKKKLNDIFMKDFETNDFKYVINQLKKKTLFIYFSFIYHVNDDSKHLFEQSDKNKFKINKCVKEIFDEAMKKYVFRFGNVVFEFLDGIIFENLNSYTNNGELLNEKHCNAYRTNNKQQDTIYSPGLAYFDQQKCNNLLLEQSNKLSNSKVMKNKSELPENIGSNTLIESFNENESKKLPINHGNDAITIGNTEKPGFFSHSLEKKPKRKKNSLLNTIRHNPIHKNSKNNNGNAQKINSQTRIPFCAKKNKTRYQSTQGKNYDAEKNKSQALPKNSPLPLYIRSIVHSHLQNSNKVVKKKKTNKDDLENYKFKIRLYSICHSLRKNTDLHIFWRSFLSYTHKFFKFCYIEKNLKDFILPTDQNLYENRIRSLFTEFCNKISFYTCLEEQTMFLCNFYSSFKYQNYKYDYEKNESILLTIYKKIDSFHSKKTAKLLQNWTVIKLKQNHNFDLKFNTDSKCFLITDSITKNNESNCYLASQNEVLTSFLQIKIEISYNEKEIKNFKSFSNILNNQISYSKEPTFEELFQNIVENKLERIAQVYVSYFDSNQIKIQDFYTKSNKIDNFSLVNNKDESALTLKNAKKTFEKMKFKHDNYEPFDLASLNNSLIENLETMNLFMKILSIVLE
ncbi:hypothetical protein GVAV_000363 [Gurleya vavrai]